SLAARSGKEVCPSAGHTAPVDLLAISPDGKTLLSSGRDRQVLRWDVAAGTPHLAVTLPAGTAFAAKGLSADVRLLALGGGKSGSVSLWDVRAGKQLRLLGKHGGAVCSVAVSADGRLVASSGQDATIRVWEAASGKQLRQIDDIPVVREGLSLLCFAPDAAWL